MDMNILRGVFTLIVMLGFIGMVLWVYSKGRKGYYQKAAHSVLESTAKGASKNE